MARSSGIGGIGRVGAVIAAQIFPIAANFLDRLVLTAIALRALGVAQFEYWSLAISLVSLLAVFDLGCMMNFSNMVVHARERGDVEHSGRLYAQANAIFLTIGVTASVFGCLVAALPALQSLLGLRADAMVQGAGTVIVLLALAAGAKLATTNAVAAYRASIAFGRGTILTAAAELSRIAATIVGIWMTRDLVGAAAGHLIGTLAGIALMQGDIARRMPTYRYRLRSPLTPEIIGSWRTSLAFAAPLLPMTAMLQAPVLFLGGHSAAGQGVVAAFVLTRTISNVLRTLIWQATNVLGMEVSRLASRGNLLGVRSLLDLLSWQMAVMLGSVAGALLAGGGRFVLLWTGNDRLFDPMALAIMLASFVLAPTYLLGTSLLNYSNTPKVWAIGTYAQVGIAAVLYLLLGNAPILLRVAASVYGAELIALAFPVAMAAWGNLGIIGFFKELARSAVAVAAGALAYGVEVSIQTVWDAPTLPSLGVAVAVCLLPGAMVVAYLTWRIARMERT